MLHIRCDILKWESLYRSYTNDQKFKLEKAKEKKRIT